jgi:hypothetical protein
MCSTSGWKCLRSDQLSPLQRQKPYRGAHANRLQYGHDNGALTAALSSQNPGERAGAGRARLAAAAQGVPPQPPSTVNFERGCPLRSPQAPRHLFRLSAKLFQCGKKVVVSVAPEVEWHVKACD